MAERASRTLGPIRGTADQVVFAPSQRLRGLAAIAGCALAVAILVVWKSGGFAAVGWWALEQQRVFQGLLGTYLREIRAGNSAAILSLLALAAGYGFVHAVGPGHGKVLVAGAAFGTAASARRMAMIALAGSLAQAAVAVVLVCGAFLLFQATAIAVVGLDAGLEPVGHAAVALVGAWLVARGVRAARQTDSSCGCGHDHGPDARAARAASLREAGALVAAMAVRPCAGALIVLVLAWSMGIPAIGVAAAFAMGIGTASFTVVLAVLAVFGRDTAFLSAGRPSSARRVAATLQIGAGAAILIVSAMLLHASIAT